MRPCRFSPSLAVGDLLHIGSDVQQLDAASVDAFHIDVIDPTFSPAAGLPVSLLQQIRSISSTPFDIHLMTAVPEMYISQLFPICEGSFIGVHIETTKEFLTLAHQIRQSGAHPAVYLNSSTPVCALESILPMVDLVTLMLCDAGRPMNLPGIKELVFPKVCLLRTLCKKLGRPDMLIQCDGGVTFEDAKQLYALGADSFVLGRDSIFAQQEAPGACLVRMRQFLERPF